MSSARVHSHFNLGTGAVASSCRNGSLYPTDGGRDGDERWQDGARAVVSMHYSDRIVAQSGLPERKPGLMGDPDAEEARTMIGAVLRTRDATPLPLEHHTQRLLNEVEQNWRELRERNGQLRCEHSERTSYILDEATHWLSEVPARCLHAIVTDPPYGLIEYSRGNLAKRKAGKGGVWRIPPAFDGAKRRPLPRFTVLKKDEITALHQFFAAFAHRALRALVPGGHLFIASNPLISTITFHSLQEAGLEKRGEIIRLVQTLRGGDRPKGAERDFPAVSVMPRSCWEPWGVFRKPLEGTVADNLQLWAAGGLRRISDEEPFKDVIPCAPARGLEKRIAPHPSLKPQRFLRRIVRASLPLGIGIVCDPFAGSGSTLAAAAALGYLSIGIDHDREYFDMARDAIPQLAALSE